MRICNGVRERMYLEEVSDGEGDSRWIEGRDLKCADYGMQ